MNKNERIEELEEMRLEFILNEAVFADDHPSWGEVADANAEAESRWDETDDGKELKALYEGGSKMTKEQAIKVSKDVFAGTQGENFPEDDWHSIGPEWDLNLWIDENGTHRATLYPVLNGNTDVSVWVDIV